MSRRRTCLLMLGLLTAAPLAQALSPARPPQVPEQVSNVAWAGDMARFASADQANPPPRGGIEFIGSSSIRFWESLATDFPGQPVFNRGFGGSEVRDSTWYAGQIVVPYAPCKVFFYAGDNDLNSGRSAMQEEINRVIVERALAGKKVVRFKGGDNFVFGRGGEEWQH